MRLDLPSPNATASSKAPIAPELPLQKIGVTQVGIGFVRGLKANGSLQRIFRLGIYPRYQIGPPQTRPDTCIIGANLQGFLELFGCITITRFLRI